MRLRRCQSCRRPTVMETYCPICLRRWGYDRWCLRCGRYYRSTTTRWVQMSYGCLPLALPVKHRCTPDPRKRRRPRYDAPYRSVYRRMPRSVRRHRQREAQAQGQGERG